MSYDYSENILVQESAGHLLQNELGWEVAFAYNTEQLGENGSFGRKSYKEILLIRYFREALLRLNPWITPAQMDEAQRKLEHRLSTASLLQINEEKYFLIRDGIPVTVKKPGGKTEEKRAVVIDFQNPGNNCVPKMFRGIKSGYGIDPLDPIRQVADLFFKILIVRIRNLHAFQKQRVLRPEPLDHSMVFRKIQRSKPNKFLRWRSAPEFFYMPILANQ